MSEQEPSEQIARQILGESEDVIHTDSLSDLISATERMVAQAQHSIRILSHDTEPEIYGRDEFVDFLSRFISERSKVAKIRILIADPARAVRHTHRLIQLWHRFPSYIDLRELRDEYARTREAFMVVDDIGLIRRPEHESPAAVITFRSLTTARARAGWFDEAFARGAASTALRRLTL